MIVKRVIFFYKFCGDCILKVIVEGYGFSFEYNKFYLYDWSWCEEFELRVV